MKSIKRPKGIKLKPEGGTVADWFPVGGEIEKGHTFERSDVISSAVVTKKKKKE